MTLAEYAAAVYTELADLDVPAVDLASCLGQASVDRQIADGWRSGIESFVVADRLEAQFMGW